MPTKKRIYISAAMIKARHDGINVYLKQIFKSYRFDQDTEHEYFVFVNKRRPDQLFERVQGLNRVEANRFNDNPVFSLLWHHLIMPLRLWYNQADLVWIPTYRRVPLLSPCKVVVTVHDVGFSAFKKYDPLRTYFHTWVTPFLLKRADKLIAVSHFTKQSLMLLLKDFKKDIRVIHSGIATSIFNDKVPRDPEEVGKRFGIYSPYILYVSRIEHPAKNHISLLRAYKRLLENGVASYDIVFVGKPDINSQVVFDAINDLGLTQRVKHISALDDLALQTLYRNASVFVCPSLYEGFGLPILEAMACGVPVVTSNRSSLPEIAGDAALLVDPLDEGQLSGAIKSMLTDQTIRADFIGRGKKRANEFSWENSSMQTVSVLKGIIA